MFSNVLCQNHHSDRHIRKPLLVSEPAKQAHQLETLVISGSSRLGGSSQLSPQSECAQRHHALGCPQYARRDFTSAFVLSSRLFCTCA
jgi:hypothetical protein